MTALPLRVGFESQPLETDALRIEWEGAAPKWLSGRLLSTGPALFEVGSISYRHWFDGLAMLYRFALTPHEVIYSNQFLRSETFAAATAEARVAHRGFAINSGSGYWSRVTEPLRGKMTDNGNIDVCAYGDDDFVALTEVPRPVRFDSTTLETLGAFGWVDDLKSHLTTAHPLSDSARRRIFNCDTIFSMPSVYRLTRMAYGLNRREVVAELRADHPSYMHSFGMSENYLVLVEFPLVTHPLRMLLSGRPFIDSYRWSPDRGTRITIVDKVDGAVMRSAVTEPCFGFRVVNAFEQDGAVVVDVVAHEDAGVVQNLFLDRLRSGPSRVAGRLTRFAVPLGEGPITQHVVSNIPLELPHFDWRRRSGQAYRQVWSVGDSDGEFMSRLQRHDLESGTTACWSEPGCHPGEPVFVASPDGDDRDDGIVLSVVLDACRRQSFLLVVDAQTLTERARVWAPHAIPFGFHGNHYPDDTRGA